MILERLEYGKPCITPDGEVEGGVSPEEYRSLYISDNFPQHKNNRWNLDTVGTNVLYSEEAAVAHIPFVSKEGKQFHWAGITQIHRIRLENQQTKRPYVISRFGAQVSRSPRYGLEKLLHPFQICATMLDEPVIGFTRNSHIEVFQVIESQPYLEWDEVRKALEYILLGVPIFISLERTEEGLFPSLEEFTSLADAVWAFLPASLRPWFSWAWNVKDFAQSKKPVAGRLMLVAGNKCPPNAAEYLGGDEWRDPEVYPEMKKNARRFVQDWLNILEGYEGDLERIRGLSQFFSDTSIVKGAGPYSRFVEKPSTIEVVEDQGYQMVLFDQLVGKKTQVLPMLQSVFFTMHSIQKARTWFEGNSRHGLQIQILRQPAAIAEFHEGVIEHYWRNENRYPEDKLLQLTWEYLLERARIKQLPQASKLSGVSKVVANFFLKLLLFEQDPNYKSARRGFVGFVKLFRENSKFILTLRSLIEGAKALPSLQGPVYSMLHYIAWPYDKVNKELTLVQLQEIVNIFCLFPEWASDASIRIAVLIEKIREVKTRNSSSFRKNDPEEVAEFEFLENSLQDLLHKTKFPELLKEILEKRPIFAAIQERISKPEQIALAAYLWMTKIEKNDEPLSVQKRDPSIDWAWTILLGVEIKKVSEVVGNSPFGDWFCLARFGLSAVKEQYPEKFEDDKTSIATKLKLAMATNLPSLWPSKEKAFTNIVEAYFTHYEKRLLDYCEPVLQERIFKRFPRYWPWLLAGSPILGAKTEANQKWGTPEISLDEFLLMQKRINSEFEAYKTEDSLFQDNLKEMIQFLWKFIPLVKLIGSKKRGDPAKKMLSYLKHLDQSVETETDPSLFLLMDSDFSEEHDPFVQYLISHSPRHWKFIKKLWLSYALVPESNKLSHGQNIFYLLRTYQGSKFQEMPVLGSHVLNLLAFRQKHKTRIFDPLYKQVQDIREKLSKEEIEDEKDIKIGLDRLEYLILKPAFLKAAKELWDERYRGTLLALCFPKTTKSFPENHFLDWKGFFFERNSLSREFKLVLKYVQMQQQLPIDRSIFLSYFNNKMSQDSSDFYAFPKQKVKYGPKSTERFAYLYSNFDQLSRPKGKVYGFITNETLAMVVVILPLAIIGLVVILFGTIALRDYLSQNVEGINQTVLTLLGLIVLYAIVFYSFYEIGGLLLDNIKPEIWRVQSTAEKPKNKAVKYSYSTNPYRRREYQIELSEGVYRDLQAIIEIAEK